MKVGVKELVGYRDAPAYKLMTDNWHIMSNTLSEIWFQYLEVLCFVEGVEELVHCLLPLLQLAVLLQTSKCSEKHGSVTSPFSKLWQTDQGTDQTTVRRIGGAIVKIPITHQCQIFPFFNKLISFWYSDVLKHLLIQKILVYGLLMRKFPAFLLIL